MRHYYAVYSIRSTTGSGFGRSTFDASGEINTMDSIKRVEDELLKLCQEQDPDAGYSHLFLVDWRELASIVPNGQLGGE